MDAIDAKQTIRSWVDLYSDGMYSWALHKTSHKETAEDLVQETFLAAVTSFGKFQGNSSPKTWLTAILNNKIHDYYRKNFRTTGIHDAEIFDRVFDAEGGWRDGERPMQWKEETGHLLDNEEFRQTLESCINALPENWHAAIQLKYMKKRNGKTICKELGVTPTNFWQMIHRAKLKLRKCLEIHWFKEQA